MITVGLDPGFSAQNAVGWAVVMHQPAMRPVVTQAGVIRPPREMRLAHLLPYLRCELVDMFASLTIHTLAVEMPRVYPRQPVRPNTLVDLAAVAGAMLSAVPAAHPLFTYPRDWAGTVPAKIRYARLLSAHQLDRFLLDVPMSLRHNAYDAAGIALWAAARAKE